MVKDTPEGADPNGSHDAFALAGNEIRMAIIKELGDAQGSRGPPATLSFSELRTRVASEMDSGQFNYHLQQLVDHFLASVEDGYRLTSGGTSLYRALRAGSFASHYSLPPESLESECHFCDSLLEALYDEGRFTVRCPDCMHYYHRQTIPPQAVGDSISDELVTLVDRHHRHQLLASSEGVCPNCINTLDMQFLPAEEADLRGDTADKLLVYVHASCNHCGHQHYMSIGSFVLYHPAVVSFCFEQGLDVTSTPVWELEFAVTDRSVRVCSRDPWRVELTLSIDGDELTLVLDESFEIREASET